MRDELTNVGRHGLVVQSDEGLEGGARADLIIARKVTVLAVDAVETQGNRTVLPSGRCAGAGRRPECRGAESKHHRQRKGTQHAARAC